MNIWSVILLAVVSVSLVFYVLTAVLGVKSEKIFGPPLMIAIVTVLLAGFGYYLLGEKSIYVVITSDEQVLHKSSVKFNDEVWHKEGAFLFSAVTMGIPVINYSQQVKDLLAGDEVKLCRDYSSQTIGTGRYKKEAGIIAVCVNKKGLRWYF